MDKKIILIIILFLLTSQCKKKEEADKNLNGYLTTLRFQKHLMESYSNLLPKTFSICEGKPGKDFVSIGSGFFIHEDGYGITDRNNLLSHDKENLYIRQGKTTKNYPVKFISDDKTTGLALLKISKKITVPYVIILPRNSPKPGNIYLGISSPFSLLDTLNTGYIVQTYRSNINPDDLPFAYNQLSTSVVKESSGAPILDLFGNLIGMLYHIPKLNGSIRPKYGFSIPTSDLFSFITRQEFYRKEKPMTSRGIVEIPITTPYLLKKLAIESHRGVLISYVKKNSPAEKSGLKRYDLIIAVNQKKIYHRSDFIKQLELLKKEKNITITIIRDNRKQSIHLSRTPLSANTTK